MGWALTRYFTVNWHEKKKRMWGKSDTQERKVPRKEKEGGKRNEKKRRRRMKEKFNKKQGRKEKRRHGER